MKRFTTIISALSILGACGCSTLPQVRDGAYVGFEFMPGYTDPVNPKAKWYHENRLAICGNSVTIEKVPITIEDGKKCYSASDGGFYTFKGTIESTNDQLLLRLKLVDSCYVMRKADGSDVNRIYSGRINQDGSLEINKVHYDVKKKE